MNKKTKVLIAYYSRTGENEAVAKVLQKELNCDIEQIIDTADRSVMFWCAMAAFFRRTTKLHPIKKNPEDYNLVVICTPLWVGTLPPATRTYIIENKTKFKNVTVLSVCGKGKENKGAVPHFESLVGKKAIASLLVTKTEVEKDGVKEILEPFIRDILAM